MKKLLFCAGVLALAASCTEDFETSSVQQEQAKGISFVATDGNEAATKGHFEEDGDFVEPFWLQIEIGHLHVVECEPDAAGNRNLSFPCFGRTWRRRKVCGNGVQQQRRFVGVVGILDHCGAVGCHECHSACQI